MTRSDLGARVLAGILAAGLTAQEPMPRPEVPSTFLEAVVQIHTTIGNTQASYGSGFFIDATGRVLTCYHVIKNASSLRVYGRGKEFRRVTVESIAPRFDLAILRVDAGSASVPFIPLLTDMPKRIRAQQLYVLGSPMGIRDQLLFARSTTEAPVLTAEFPRTFNIFNPAIADARVLPLDLLVYDGLSGGPVLCRDGAIGVLSGSVNEGGSLAWAIPAEYTLERYQQAVAKSVADIRSWERVLLMAGTTAPLRLRSKLYERDETKVQDLMKAAQDLEVSQDAFVQQAVVTASALAGFLKAVKEADLTGKLTEAQWEVLRVGMTKIGKTADQYSSAGESLTKAAAHAWMCAQRLADSVDDGIPYTQKNKRIIDELSQELTATVAVMEKNERFFEARARDEEAVLRRMMGGAESTEEIIGLLGDAQRSITLWTNPTGLEMLEARVRTFRDVARAVEKFYYAGLDAPNTNWTYESALGYSIVCDSRWRVGTDRVGEVKAALSKQADALEPVEDVLFFVEEGKEGAPGTRIMLHTRMLMMAADWEGSDLSAQKRDAEKLHDAAVVETMTVGTTTVLIVRGRPKGVGPSSLGYSLVALVPCPRGVLAVTFNMPEERVGPLVPICLDVVRSLSLTTPTRELIALDADSRGQCWYYGAEGFRIRCPSGYELIDGDKVRASWRELPSALQAFARDQGLPHATFINWNVHREPGREVVSSVNIRVGSHANPEELLLRLQQEDARLMNAVAPKGLGRFVPGTLEKRVIRGRLVAILPVMVKYGETPVQLLQYFVPGPQKYAVITFTATRVGEPRFARECDGIVDTFAFPCAACPEGERHATRKGAEAGDVGKMVELALQIERSTGGAPGPDSSLSWLLKADQKASVAEYEILGHELGRHYYHGIGTGRDYDRARVAFEKGAACGDPRAMTTLGAMLELGQAGPVDYVGAARNYSRAAAAGYGSAMYNIGAMYADGRGVARDVQRARLWFKRAEQAGCALGISQLGYCYEKGLGVEQDRRKALEYYRRAAESPNAPEAGSVYLRLAVAYLYWDGVVERQPEQARILLQKGAAMGDEACLVHLGWLYEKGDGVARDPVKAADHYERAAQLGYVEGMMRTGRVYLRGIGRPVDYEKAHAWLGKAASYQSVGAYGYLGECYSEGLGCEKDLAKAYSFWVKAAKAGDVESMRRAGIALLNGSGCRVDPWAAREWFLAGAEKGDAVCINHLGWMCVSGTGAIANGKEAIAWFEKAVDAQDTTAAAYARQQLGVLYAEGKLVRRDDVKAYGYFDGGSGLGDLLCLEWLAYFLEEGRGCERDLNTAIVIYETAKARGSKFAEERLKILRR